MAAKIVLTGQTATCVYDDRFRPLLEALGPLQVRRASEVEFDQATGDWIATHLETGQMIARGKNRAEVITAEVWWLERRMQ